MSSLWGRVIYAQSHVRPWSARITQVAAACGCQFDFQTWKTMLLLCRLASALESQHSGHVAFRSLSGVCLLLGWSGRIELSFIILVWFLLRKSSTRLGLTMLIELYFLPLQQC